MRPIHKRLLFTKKTLVCIKIALFSLYIDIIEAKIASTKSHISELQDHIKTQPMSANVAKKLRKEMKEKQDSLSKMYQSRDEAYQRVGELQMIHNQSVSKIDTICRQVNDSLRKLTALLPDASCVTPLDYNTSKRADPGVLIQLVEQNKRIKVIIFH